MNYYHGLQKLEEFETMTDTGKQCKNCNSYFEGNYCNYCGQKANAKRFTASNLSREFLKEFFDVDSTLLFTIKELFVRPGEMLRGYIAGKRISYLNSFAYLLIISLIAGFVYTWSGVPNKIDEIMLTSGEIIKFTSNHFSYRMLITIPAYAIICCIIYKSHKYNFAEYFIINTYLISQSIIFLVLWIIINSFIKPGILVFEILYYSAFFSVIIYQIIVYFQLFNSGNTLMRWLKAIISVITGLVMSFILMNLIITFINIFSK
jgi:hypothetical protein